MAKASRLPRLQQLPAKVSGQDVSLRTLAPILDELKSNNGEVWYYRESPDIEPSESMNKLIEQVLDEVISRKLPIKLQQEEY